MFEDDVLKYHINNAKVRLWLNSRAPTVKAFKKKEKKKKSSVTVNLRV